MASMKYKVTKKLDRDSKYQQPGFKGFLHWWLENSNNKKANIVDLVLYLLIVLSVFIVFFEFSFEEEKIPNYVYILNNMFLSFFAIEYLARFYIGTDFFWDIFKEKGSILTAIKNKLKWTLKIQSIIDLLAILPAIRFLRIFRVARIIRVLRILRFLRMLKLYRQAERLTLIFKGLNESWRIFVILILVTVGILGLLSYGIFLVEPKEISSNLDTFWEAYWHSIKLVGLGEDSPQTIAGKFLSSIVKVCNILFVSFVISLMTVKMRDVMEKIKDGRFGSITIRDHIVLCGLTRGTREVVKALLEEKSNRNGIVLITLKDDPDINGVIYIHGDYSDMEILKKANISHATRCIIFAERKNDEDRGTTDMRTILTVFHIESEYPHVHTIAEINNSENAKIIESKIQGDEILLKEVIDAKIIENCIKIPNISYLINDLIGLKDKNIQLKKVATLNNNIKMTFKHARIWGVENDCTVLGIIKGSSKPLLSPPNDQYLDETDDIIYIQ
jgi:voltage-gated potassium channel